LDRFDSIRHRRFLRWNEKREQFFSSRCL
jgi:hypothetical protein